MSAVEAGAPALRVYMMGDVNSVIGDRRHLDAGQQGREIDAGEVRQNGGEVEILQRVGKQSIKQLFGWQVDAKLAERSQSVGDLLNDRSRRRHIDGRQGYVRQGFVEAICHGRQADVSDVRQCDLRHHKIHGRDLRWIAEGADDAQGRCLRGRRGAGCDVLDLLREAARDLLQLVFELVGD